VNYFAKLKEFVANNGGSTSRAADILGYSYVYVHNMLNEKSSITDGVIARITAGGGAKRTLSQTRKDNMQTQYRFDEEVAFIRKAHAEEMLELRRAHAAEMTEERRKNENEIRTLRDEMAGYHRQLITFQQSSGQPVRIIPDNTDRLASVGKSLSSAFPVPDGDL